MFSFVTTLEGVAAADPIIHEIWTHLDAQRQHIVATIATKVEGGATNQGVRYYDALRPPP